MKLKNLKKAALKKLELFELNNIFGSQQNESLTFKLPSSRVALNRTLLREINKMKNTAAHYRMLYLTANQAQSFHRLFVINNNYSLGTHTSEGYSNPHEFQAYINPVITQTMGEKVEVEESCLVIPFIKFLVPRYQEIKLEFRDENRDYREQIITGTLAYWIQHCINHLDGELLFDYNLSKGKFFVSKDIVINFPKTSFLLREYSLRLKNHHELIAKDEATINDEKFVLMKQDYMSRLRKEYKKQSEAFSLKIEQKKMSIF